MKFYDNNVINKYKEEKGNVVFRVPLPLSTLTVSMFSDSASMPVRGTASQKPPIGESHPTFCTEISESYIIFKKPNAPSPGKSSERNKSSHLHQPVRKRVTILYTQRTFLPFRGSRFHGCRAQPELKKIKPKPVIRPSSSTFHAIH